MFWVARCRCAVFNKSFKTTTGVGTRAFLSSGRDSCVCDVEIAGLHFLYDFIEEKNYQV